ncbi:outer membrane protein [Gymnodinialimonas hymeniacidonis]|uniref:outer membrane protein n=1 Tax=Gymnodinialimonas hymeniacidonis TaxID=3126508 RepID=UPI0034C68B8D
MNRTLLPLVAAISLFAIPASAQSSFESPGDWGGVYVGFQADLYAGNSLTFSDLPFVEGEIEGFNTGIFVGYLRQSGALVYGGEVEFLGGDVDSNVSIFGIPGAIDSYTTITRFGGQVGYDAGRIMPYATAGLGLFSFQDTANGDNRSLGTFAGLGVNVRVGEHASVGAEVIRHSFDDFSGSDTLGLELTTVGVNIAFRY